VLSFLKEMALISRTQTDQKSLTEMGYE